MSFWKRLVARWGSGDGETADVRIDKSTNSLQIVEYEHHEIHAGSHYNISDYQLGNNASAIIDITAATPAGPDETHLTFSIYSSSGATVELYAGLDPGDVTGGTSLHLQNNNGNSIKTIGMTVLKDPTITETTLALLTLA